MKILNTKDLFKRENELQKEFKSYLDNYYEGKEGALKAISDWFGLEEEDGLKYVLDEFKNKGAADFRDFLNSDESEELFALIDLFEEVSWENIDLISENDFEEFARDYAADLGLVDESMENYVRWADFAADLKGDYSKVEFQGTTYFYREP